MNPHQELRWADWQEFRTSSSPEVHWRAIETLANHLDDHLVLVDDQDFQNLDFSTSPARLTIFEAKDEDRTPLFALATTAGHVIVGRCDRLGTHYSHELAGFDPRWDEILSLAVTGGSRWLGDYLDLWVMVRRHHGDGPRDLAYHGIVWLNEQGWPRLRPARDDQELRDQQVWQAQAADRFPDWLHSYPLSFTPGIEPFAGFPGKKLCEDAGNINAMAWAESSPCYARGDELCLIHERVVLQFCCCRVQGTLKDSYYGVFRGTSRSETTRLKHHHSRY